MRQKRLSALSLLAIESELVKGMDFEDLIIDFACTKVEKKRCSAKGKAYLPLFLGKYVTLLSIWNLWNGFLF